MDDSEVEKPILKGVLPKTGISIEKDKRTDITIKAGGGNTGTNLLFYKYIIKDSDGNVVNTPYYSLDNTFSIKPEKEGEYTVDVYVQSSDNHIDKGTVKYTSFLPHKEHTWDNGKITTQPTETADGKKTYTCTVCGETKTEKIPAIGSSEPSTDPSTPPTSSSVPKVGTKLKDAAGKAVYKVTSADKTNPTVEFTAPVNKKAKSVTIPATVEINGITYKVTSIAKNAFKNNNKLTKATIGKNVTTIGDRAFYKCTSLKKITIPSKISKIGKQAFYGCKKLKSITIKTTKLTSRNVGKQAFKKIYAKATIKVPKSKLKAYRKLLKSKGVSSKAKIKK